MAERGNLNIARSARILYEVYRRSIWLNLANRSWEAEFRNSYKGVIPYIDVTVTGVDQADTQALESPLTFATSDISEQEITRSFYTATGQVNARQIVEANAGGQIESKLAREIGIDIAQKVDGAVSGVVTGATYGTATGNGYQVTVGVSGANGWGFTRATPAAFSSKGTDTTTLDEALEALVESLSEARLRAQRLNLIGQKVIGPDSPSNLACVLPPELADLLGRHFRRQGVELMPGSAGRQAIADSGILSNSAYMGRVAGIDLVTDNSLTVPTGSADWQAYVVPTRAAFAAGMTVFRNQRYGPADIPTGEYVERLVASVAYWAKVLRQEHLGRVTVRAQTG